MQKQGKSATTIKKVYSMQNGMLFRIETQDGRLYQLNKVRKGAMVPMPGQDISDYAGLAYLVNHA